MTAPVVHRKHGGAAMVWVVLAVFVVLGFWFAARLNAGQCTQIGGQVMDRTSTSVFANQEVCP